jgi:tRNA dimethylallyltransferase
MFARLTTPQADRLTPSSSAALPKPGTRPQILALFGPTAAGKSALAHLAALSLGGEIVVADPFQRYRGLEIAADSPTAQERSEVAYHFVGDLALTEASSAGAYARAAHRTIDDILARGRLPIVAGGTGLYLRAALADLDFPADAPEEVRRAVEQLVADDVGRALGELRRRAPAVAARIDTRNPRRVSRALELARMGTVDGDTNRLWTGVTRYPTRLVGVVRPRPVLDRLIALRVGRELAAGLVAELEAALATPGVSRSALQIIGVREVLAIREGTLDPSSLPAALAARTRRLARAQLAWLRKTPGVTELDIGEARAEDALPDLMSQWTR